MQEETISVLTSALSRSQFKWESRTHTGTPSPEVQSLPFYKFVPKDPIEQLRWRYYVREQVNNDDNFRMAIDYACSQDILFAINTLFWIFETRPVGRHMPFNTWADQDDYIVWFYKCINDQRDAIGEKCRGIGWSYLLVGIGYYDWKWPPIVNGVSSKTMGGMVSRKKEAVDDPNDSDSLFWKLDYIHKYMPECYKIGKDGQDILKRTAFNFSNRENGSIIGGYEAGPNAMTGGRKRWIIHDEAAKFPRNAQEILDSTQHVTNCRLVISTFFHGTQTRFYEMARKDKDGALRVIGDWKTNPERKRGMYTFEQGELKILDTNFDFPADYKYVNKEVDRDAVGGKIRSPWYDAECTRLGSTRRSIAEEVDRDPQNTGTKFFDTEAIEQLDRTTESPRHVGKITWRGHPKNSNFVSDDTGSLWLWKGLADGGGLDDCGPFVSGSDLAGGHGSIWSAYSSLVVFDEPTGEQVLEFVSNRLRPDDFAEHCYAIFCWLIQKRGQSWLRCNFETNNGTMGITFGERLIQLGWGNFYQDKKPLEVLDKRIMRYGWWNKDRGEGALTELQRAILTSECTIHSERIKNEANEYERDEDYKLIHVASHASKTRDGSSHGDSMIAAGCAWMARYDGPNQMEKKRQRPIPRDSVAGQVLAEYARSRYSDGDNWDTDLSESIGPFGPILQMIEDRPYYLEDV